MPGLNTRSNVELFYKIWGTGRPVILIHGWPLSADSWDDIALPLADAGFQTIAYDRRGFGRSEQTWEGYDYDTLADDLADVIRGLNLADATIVGFSMGGGEVARYMSRHNGLEIRQAVLISSVVPYMLKTETNPYGVEQATFDEMTKAMKADRAAFFGSFFKDFYAGGASSPKVSQELLEWTRTVAMQSSLKATLACAQAFATTDFRSDLESFRVPTLVIHGTGDKTVPIDAAGRAAAAGIKDAKLVEYEGAPHGLFATHKKQLVQDLISFISS
ncbi:MAG: alpha/beta hydrolase [Planctomycetaceae bacterium]|nr:alpha/beta hydrolase [Planctomycetaceae bacterium]